VRHEEKGADAEFLSGAAMIHPIGEYRVLQGKERQPISGMDKAILWN
jgi:hypothetical protein